MSGGGPVVYSLVDGLINHDALTCRLYTVRFDLSLING